MTIKPEKHILVLTTKEGFLAKFCELCSDYSSQEMAYEAAERLHQMYFDKRKYANYESFKSSKNRTNRKKNE